MKTRISRLAPYALSFLALMLVMGAQPAQGCSCYCDSYCQMLRDCCGWCQDAALESSVVQVSPLPQRGAKVVISGLQTMAMSTGACAAALQQVSGIESVRSVKLVNTATAEVIYNFTPNEIASRSFEDLMSAVAGDRRMSGFKADVQSFIPDRSSAHFEVEVTLARGVNLFALAANLRNGYLGGGSANADGSLDMHHVFLRSLKDFDIQVSSPRAPRRDPIEY